MHFCTSIGVKLDARNGWRTLDVTVDRCNLCGKNDSYIAGLDRLAADDRRSVNDRSPDHLCNEGSIRVAQRSRLSTSLSVTVITSVAPSMDTWPKNCRPKEGAR